MANRGFSLLNRFLQFRSELALLWRAFRDSSTPLHIKALMLLVPLYLLSPIDLIPDFLPFAGWLDDVIIVPLLVSWIFGMVQRSTKSPSGAAPRNDSTIDGSWRRL
jgi:uncharacterized membrane protein YkvA (DUF1232 family)